MLRTVRHYSKVINIKDKGEKAARVITSEFAKLKDHYDAPKYPIVLCHGFSGFDRLGLFPLPNLLEDATATTKTKEITERSLIELDYWYGIKDALENLGSTVFIAKVPAFGDIRSRAISLDKFIEKQCKALRQTESKSSIYNKPNSSNDDTTTFKDKHQPIKVNLISHSMGGLDSRYLISRIHNDNENYRVASLTTILTPHHGSECADFIADLIGDNGVLKKVCPPSIYQLTTLHMKKFNEVVKDDPSVQYFSFGARFNPRWYNLFGLTWLVMKYQIEKEQADRFKHMIDNDGLVSVESSKWGQYIGTLDEVDHLDLINWTNRARSVFDKVMFAQNPNFNPIALYLEIADLLSKKGL
ncbi:Lipase 2 [Candida viswanathii]|uniref:Lipase 2 n=1 Tax=Candida viswanathii TaxID=5486 RepID=A0A367Y3I1_9ASCO|nr:Lipase 2 [Candida viswanathii]